MGFVRNVLFNSATSILVCGSIDSMFVDKLFNIGPEKEVVVQILATSITLLDDYNNLKSSAVNILIMRIITDGLSSFYLKTNLIFSTIIFEWLHL